MTLGSPRYWRTNTILGLPSLSVVTATALAIMIDGRQFATRGRLELLCDPVEVVGSPDLVVQKARGVIVHR
jgi:hypothetical protein